MVMYFIVINHDKWARDKKFSWLVSAEQQSGRDYEIQECVGTIDYEGAILEAERLKEKYPQHKFQLIGVEETHKKMWDVIGREHWLWNVYKWRKSQKE